MSSEPFVLGQSSTSIFRTALDVSKELTKQGKIRYRVGPGGTLSLKVDDAALKEVLSKREVDHKDYSRILDSEISVMLNAILTKEGEALTSFRCDPESNRELRDHTVEEISEYKKSFEQKLAWISTELITDELHGKILVKRTSKHERLKNHTWEIKEKLVDQELGELASYPYATLAFDTVMIERETPEIFTFFKYLLPGFQAMVGRTESTIFDVDLDDLSDLIDSLTDAKKALAGRRGKKAKT